MLGIKPDLVKMKETVTGYTGEIATIKDRITNGLHLIDENGVIGDPTLASGGRGKAYIDEVVDYIFDNLNSGG